MKLMTILAAVTLTYGAAAQANDLNTLQNLERERAQLLATALRAETTPLAQRQALDTSTQRLIDIERMAIRDERLQGHGSPLVEACFEDYDRCFLVHASAENQQSVLDHWLTRLGVTTDALGASQHGRR